MRKKSRVSEIISLATPVKIDKLVPGGQGIATLEDGKKLFLWSALPGEFVSQIKITKKKSKYLEGIALEITQKSPARIEPKDACHLSTSPWQIMNYDYELAQKSAILREIFRQQGIGAGKSGENPLPITNGRDLRYRNKMEYALYWDNDEERIKPAFHLRGSHQKVPVENSSIERPEIFQKALEVIQRLNNKKEQARKYQSLLIRCDQQGRTAAALFENGKPHPVLPPLSDVLLGREYTYSPTGFFQINLPVYELALKEIKKHIETEKVLDLYAGVGTIGLSVAADKNLTLVEVNKDAYGELLRNCETFSATPKSILAKSEEVLDFITPDATIILDPPRAGADKKLIDKLLEVKPPKIIYLSCSPITQARDIAPFLSSYKIEKLQPFNFFPRTPHIENLAVLSLR